MPPNPVAMSTIFSKELYWQKVAKILESINLNKKTNITWCHSLYEIGPNGLKFIYEIQITEFLYALFKTLQTEPKVGFFLEWPNQDKRMKIIGEQLQSLNSMVS